MTVLAVTCGNSTEVVSIVWSSGRVRKGRGEESGDEKKRRKEKNIHSLFGSNPVAVKGPAHVLSQLFLDFQLCELFCLRLIILRSSCFS